MGWRGPQEVRCWEARPQQDWLSKDSRPLSPSRQPGSPPSRPLPLLPLWRNQKTPVQRQAMGLFLALWGKSACLPSVQKYMVYEPGGRGARQGSKPVPAGRLPPALWSCASPRPGRPHGSVGQYCFQTARDEALLGPSGTRSPLKLRAAVMMGRNRLAALPDLRFLR